MVRAQRLARVVAAIVVFITSAALAHKPTFESASALYAEGDYRGAAREAGTLSSAQGHGLAARALLAHAMTEAAFDARRPFFEEALKQAEAALALDSKVVEGHLQYVIAIGHIGRLDGPLAAQARGYPDQAKSHIDAALALEPDNPWALATLGAWNIEIARSGILGIGRLLFGASRKAGMAAFDRAVVADADNVVVPYEYALALLALDARRYREAARGMLDTALTRVARDAYGRTMQTRAKTLQARLDVEDWSGLKDLVDAYEGEKPLPAEHAATGLPK